MNTNYTRFYDSKIQIDCCPSSVKLRITTLVALFVPSPSWTNFTLGFVRKSWNNKVNGCCLIERRIWKKLIRIFGKHGRGHNEVCLLTSTIKRFHDLVSQWNRFDGASSHFGLDTPPGTPPVAHFTRSRKSPKNIRLQSGLRGIGTLLGDPCHCSSASCVRFSSRASWKCVAGRLEVQLGGEERPV